jgi:hypothetical protein
MNEKQRRLALIRSTVLSCALAAGISCIKALPHSLRIFGAAAFLVLAAMFMFPLFFPACAARIKKWAIKEIDKEPVDQHMGRWVP